ncbi:DNA (cytosine-5-)-methyltransferase [Bacteroides graminisolvens]|uniref:DNA (cytosine-5-)-methyltransferase n=1 Tax=Bacteroides graminisolvens TaxID=477666 RepID=UPI0023F219F5|nr:DNA (cytosine-5-)-methyltransferase [Bacteroides graminisolvens]
MTQQAISLKNFPEKISVQDIAGQKIKIHFYGPKSYDNQLALITHYLHNKNFISDFSRKQAIKYLKEYIQYKFPKLEITPNILKDPLQAGIFEDFFHIPFPDPQKPLFTFIDLFAGMGGFRLAMQKQGGKCIFSSEWNSFAQKTYFANFGEMPFGDITKEETKQYIPQSFDILCAGFPCQPFSIAGVSKKNSLGRETGFKDKTQGTLFFDVADIISRHRPKAFYLENVKNLMSHDKGNTFKVIISVLEELEYSVHYQVMDGKAFVPQHRERIMIVGFDKRRFNGCEKFTFPKLGEPTKRIKDILDNYPDYKYTLSDKLWNYLQSYAEKHKAKGNGFGFGIADLNGISRTLSARYYKDGSEILIPQGEGINPRRLTPRECARLMGYPDEYIINKVSDLQAYRQCGNSVVVPLITSVSEQLVTAILK